MDLSSDVVTAVQEVSAAAPEYERGWAFYEGNQDEAFVAARVARLLGAEVSEFNINLSRRIVDARLDRLKIAQISVIGDDAEGRLTAALNDAVWTANSLGKSVRTVQRCALTRGDAYMIVEPGDEDGAVQVYFNSPERCRVFYNPVKPQEKLFAAQVWDFGTRETPLIRVNLWYPDRTERWVSKAGQKGDLAEHYEHFLPNPDDPDSWVTENPFDELPVFHFRTDETYGQPVHADAFGPQNAINKLVVTLMATVEEQGFNQRYRLMKPRAGAESDGGMDDSAMPGAAGDIHPDEQDEPDEMVTGAGTLLTLPGDAAGHFPATNPQGFLNTINFFARAMGASTATPLRFLDPTGTVPSGESLRADEAPLVESIGDLQTWLGDEWRAMLRYAMRVAGHEVEGISLTWQPIQRSTDKEGFETALSAQKAGVPRRRTLLDLGYLPSEIEEWMKEGSEVDIESRINQLVRISEATSKLGQAVALGVMDQGRARALIDDLIGDAERGAEK